MIVKIFKCIVLNGMKKKGNPNYITSDKVYKNYKFIRLYGVRRKWKDDLGLQDLTLISAC